MILCLHCTVFWDARIAASHLRQSDTRLPDIPEQSRFIEKWFEWYRGYKTILNEDGTVERRPLHGGSLGEVPPGHLPRSLDEFDTPSDSDEIQGTADTFNGLATSTSSIPSAVPIPQVTQYIDPEDRLFDSPPSSPSTSSMDLDSASPALDLNTQRPPQPTMPSSISPPNLQTRFQSTATRINRRPPPNTDAINLTSDDSGGTDLGRNDAADASATRRTSSLLSQSRNEAGRNQNATGTRQQAEAQSDPQLRHLLALQATISRQRDEAEAIVNDITQRHRRGLAEGYLRRVERELHEIQRQTTQYQNSVRVFGTREEVERQGADYVSPITDLFTNAYHSMSTDTANNTILLNSTQQAPTHGHPPGSNLSPYQSSSSSSSSGVVATAETPAQGLGQRRVGARLTLIQRAGTDENANPSSNSSSHRGTLTRRRARSSTGRSGPALSTATNLEHNAEQNNNHSAERRQRTWRAIAGEGRDLPGRQVPRRHIDLTRDSSHPTYPMLSQTDEDRMEWERLAASNDGVWAYSNILPYETSDPAFNPQANLFSPGMVNERFRHLRDGRSSTNPFNATDPSSTTTTPEGLNTRRYLHRAMLQQMRHQMEQTPRKVGLDLDKTKPPPLSKEEMKVERECKVCMEQLATVALLPCGTSKEPMEFLG